MFPIKIDLKETEGISIFTVSGRIDQQTYYDFRDKLRSYISGGKNRIVVDLSDVEIVSSGGWNTIVNDREYAAKTDGDIKLCCMNKNVKNIFQGMDLHEFIKAYDTVEEAIKSFKNGNNE